tara:strand:+ start:8712 stop:9116 length:405 start_codon:yes stop_codon:yes gene_type:complete
MMDEHRKIYIAGPMRGRPNWNYDEFNKTEKILIGNGWEVVNPATLDTNYEDTADLGCEAEEFDPDGNDKHKNVNRKIMKRDLDIICDECCAIYMLKGWQMSQGACAEFYLACSLGLDIYYEGCKNDIGSDRLCF